MTKKRFAVRLLSAILVLALCLGLSTTAFAADVSGEAALSVELQMDTNVTTPAVSFTYEISKVSLDGVETDEAKAAMPAILDQTIEFTAADSGTTPVGSNLKTVTKTTANIVPAADQFSHAGVYKYHIKEKSNTYTEQAGETLVCSLAEYDMSVYVENDEDPANAGMLSVKYIVTQYTKDENGAEKTDKSPVQFANKFSKNGGKDDPNGAKALKISKAVEGSMGDKSSRFDFTLTLNKLSALEAAGTSYTGTIHRADGTATETVTLSAAGASFKLADGEYLEFDSVPVGTVYSVSETQKNSDGYTTTVETLSNGAASEAESDILVGEKANSVQYTNTKDGNVPTGIIVNNLPFILLILVALCGFAGYIVFRRRKYGN